MIISRIKNTVSTSMQLYIVVFLLSCNDNLDNEIIDSSPIPSEYVTALTTWDDIWSAIEGSVYYINAETGNDTTGRGTLNNPWKSLAKVQEVVKNGDGVLLGSGEYGDFDFTTPRDEYVTYMNQKGATPIMNSIQLRSNSPAKNLHLIFYGIKIQSIQENTYNEKYPVASLNPQYTQSNTGTYSKSRSPVSLKNVNFVQFYHCELLGANKYLCPGGIIINLCQDIIVERCLIQNVTSGISISGSNGVHISYNHIHTIIGSFVKCGNNCSKVYVEGNHGHNSNWDISDDWCPRADTPHGSAVSVRSGDLVICQNIFHDGCNSSGMMLYTDAGIIFNNILIENNLLYDIHNVYLIRLYNTGDNIVIRNNTLIGRYRNTTNGSFLYEKGIAHQSIGEGCEASGVSVYNNIVVAQSGLYVKSSGAHNHEGNNIFWSLCDAGIEDWNERIVSDAELEASKIITSTKESPDIFEDGFFKQVPDFTPNHGETIDFHIQTNCLAVNFGDTSRQSVNSLGNLGADGFIQLDGNKRNQQFHSAGAYEVPH